MMKRTLIALTLITAILQSPFVKAQDPQAPPSVTFQVEVNYVDVDVVVTDETGQFHVGPCERQTSRSSRTASRRRSRCSRYVEIPVERQSRYVFADRPIAVDTQSNRQPFAGRLYVIVLDDSGRRLHADLAGEEIGQRNSSEVHGRQRRRRRHPHERPHRCGAGVHGQQATALCRHRQVPRPPHALAHARAARHVLSVDSCRRRKLLRPTTATRSSPRRPIPAATAGWSRAISSAATARSACSTRSEVHGRVSRQRPRTAEGRSLLQRRHRLSDLRLVRRPECVRT